MTDPINIHDELQALCTKLGLDYDMTYQLNIHTLAVEAHLYAPDENGSKHVDADGFPVFERHVIQVRT